MLVGTPVPGVDPTNLSPPEKLLSIISHWVEKSPQFLYSAPLMEKTDLVTFHGPSKSSTSQPSVTAESCLAGLMSWCVLAPCYHHPGQDTARLQQKSLAEELVSENKLFSASSGSSTGIDSGVSATKTTEDKDKGPENEEKEFHTLVAKLHANLLSVVLSDSQSFSRDTLTSDHIAVSVAALLGLSNHQPAQLKRRGGKTTTAAVSGGDTERQQELDESVERLAQFLQISLSTGLLALSSGKIMIVSLVLFF